MIDIRSSETVNFGNVKRSLAQMASNDTMFLLKQLDFEMGWAPQRTRIKNLKRYLCQNLRLPDKANRMMPWANDLRELRAVIIRA